MSATSPAEGRKPRGPLLSAVIRSRIVRQTALFTASSGIGSVVSAVSAAILARNLSVDDFGAYSFALAFLGFAALFFDFGLSSATSRMLAQSRTTERREMLGAAVVAFLPIGALFALTVFALSFAVNNVFNVHSASALRVTAPIAFAYALMPIGLQIAQGMDRLHVYSITSAGAQLLFLSLLLLAVATTGSLGVTTPLGLRGGALLVCGVFLVLWLRPRFGDVQDRIRRILGEMRAYGAQVYLGRLLGIGTYNMDVLMVAGWANARQVGLYSLAGAIAAAFGLPVYGMAFALFPRFVQRRTIDRQWLVIATVAGAGGLILLWAIRDPLLRLFFSSRYLGAGRYIVPLAAAQAVRGVTAVYNSFLSAHGRGRDLRNAAVVLTGSNLVLNFALIPPFGAYGAAWASLAALVANLCAHMVFYRRGTSERVVDVR